MFSSRALKNLMESMDDRLLVLCHGGLPMMYEVRRSVKSPLHEVTSCRGITFDPPITLKAEPSDQPAVRQIAI